MSVIARIRKFIESGSYSTKRLAVAISDAATYTVLSTNSGKVHHVPELAADITITLPSVSAGLYYEFVSSGVAADAQDWIFTTGSDTNYFNGGVVQHDPDDGGDDTLAYFPDGNSESKMSFLTPSGGTRVTLYCNGTLWTVNGVLISATNTGVVFADQ